MMGGIQHHAYQPALKAWGWYGQDFNEDKLVAIICLARYKRCVGQVV
jgi:hypothetical protein